MDERGRARNTKVVRSALLLAIWGCSADHASVCQATLDETFRIDYGPLSKDCVTGAGIALPTQAYFPLYPPVRTRFGDQLVEASAKIDGCSAQFSVSLDAADPSMSEYVNVRTQPGHHLDIGGDGTLRGTAEVEVGTITGSSPTEVKLNATCKATGQVLLTPEPRPDAGSTR